ncbi:MAG TPA: hypothetical protein VGC67_10240 [Cellulomonas sp.]
MIALEVRLTPVPDDQDVRDVRRLRERFGPDLMDAAVITTAPVAFRRPDGIALITAALLGP